MLLKSLVLVSVLGLMLLVLVEARDKKNDSFEDRHMDPGNFPNNSNYCNVMMKNRGLLKTCKDINTFVHEPLGDVQAVCQQRTVPCRNRPGSCHQSTNTMRITECVRLENTSPKRCIYKTNTREKHIIIVCAGNQYLPTYFDAAV